MIKLSLQTTTGIYVGTRNVYIAQLKGTLFGRRLVKFGQAEIQGPGQTDGSSKQRIQAIAQAIKRVVRENNIATNKVFTAVAGKDVLIRHFQMPKIPKAEQQTAIKFEARKYIPFKIEDLLWDFHVVSSMHKAAKMEVIFVAVKREVAQRHLSVLQEAGLKTLALEPAPFSLLRIFALSNQLSKEKPSAIVDIDYGMANINIVKGRACYLTRDASLPKEQEVIFDNLLNEIRMSLDYYEKLFPAEQISKILLSGEVGLRDWDRRMAEELKLPIEQPKLARTVKFGKLLPPKTFAVPISLGLRGLVKAEADVNLLREREVKPRIAVKKGGLEFTPELRQAILRAVILSGIGLLTLYLVMLGRLFQEKKQLEEVISLRPKLSLAISSFSYADIEETKKELEKKLSTLDLVIDKRTLWTNKFNELPKIIPHGVWLNNLSITDELSRGNRVSRSLIISGTAYHENPVQEIGLVTKFASGLRENEVFARGFKEITMDGMSSAELSGMQVKKFTISCKQ